MVSLRIFGLLCVFAAVFVIVKSDDACEGKDKICVSDEFCQPSHRIEGVGCSKKGEICCKRMKCRELGGECIENCPETIWKLGAKSNDCPENTKCCVWLQ